MKNDPDYFKTIDSDDKAYFIGFFAADGSINKDENKISICLNIDDIEILEKYCEFSKCKNKISKNTTFDKRTNKNYHNCTLQITCKKTVEIIKKYKITRNKSKDYIITNIPEQYISSCLRGLIDGDGSISEKTISLITTKENIEFIKKYLLKHNIKIQKYVEIISEDKNVYKMYIGKYRFRFLNLIYKNSTIHLKRKYEQYIKYLKIYQRKSKKITQRKIKVFKDDIFIKEFNSIKECSKSMNIPSDGICRAASGLQKTCYGYSFVSGEKYQIEKKSSKLIL